MTAIPTNAVIEEINGPCYDAKLEWIPRVGELIDFHSFVDQAAGKPSRGLYKVVQVLHKIYEVSETHGMEHKGSHSARIFVKRTRSKIVERSTHG